jgi:hypothetical protein
MTPARRDDLIGLILALVIVVATIALANLLPAARPMAPASTASPETDPTCLEWSDGCTVCARTPGGPACSTPGIACVPQERQCLRR